MTRRMERWSDEDLVKLNKLREEGLSHDVIAERFSTSVVRVKNRICWDNKNDETRERLKKRVQDRRKRKSLGYSSSHPDKPSTGPAVTREQLAERAMRLAAPCRDIAGMLFGDPPVGYSALERRA